MAFYTTYLRRWRTESAASDSPADPERASLLNPASARRRQNGSIYSAVSQSSDESDQEGSSYEDEEDSGGEDGGTDDAEIKKNLTPPLGRGGLWSYLQGFLVFLPIIWPYKSRRVQLWMLVMAACILAERVLVVLIPVQLGSVADSLVRLEHGPAGQFPAKELIIWGLLKFPILAATDLLKGMAGTRISQFAHSQLKKAAFAHVLGLSMDYHSAKSTGELMRAIEQGSDITSLLNNFLFSAAPMVVDIVVAAIYLSLTFDAAMGLIIFTTSVTYIYASIKQNNVSARLERTASKRSRAENKVLYDSVSNWQAVAHHNRQTAEGRRYGEFVDREVVAQRRYDDWSHCCQMVQTLVMDIGLLMACFVVARRVQAGLTPASRFVLLISYWDAINEPMTHLYWTFHETAADLINAEWLLGLLKTEPSVQDKDGASELVFSAGKVEFTDVSFAYDRSKPVLQDITFTAQPGQTVAVVGETGSGKSTLLKLLYRFYDVTGGRVAVDDQDVRDVTLDSLRGNLGAVPQDAPVFDQTILDNVRYGRSDASDAEVVAACRAAALHDKIASLPAGYRTYIGERGVRLSGGERQRLAIARVVLQRPRILILDEATSAVDSATEADIQDSLRSLSRGRTTFIVAHRLATVVHADLILALNSAGRIVERGTHAELLKKGGYYSQLWAAQTGDHRVS